MRTRREATRITCAGRVAATIVNTTASSAKTAELKGLPDCHASRLTDTSGTVSTPAIARSDGRHPALIATIAKPNAICQAIARERHSFESRQSGEDHIGRRHIDDRRTTRALPEI